MKSDLVFCEISRETQELLQVSRQIFDSEASRIMDEQRTEGDRLYSLLFARAGITDPYLRGCNRHRQALESGEAPIANLGQYFDAEIQELKDHFNETNRAITDWSLHRGDCDQE